MIRVCVKSWWNLYAYYDVYKYGCMSVRVIGPNNVYNVTRIYVTGTVYGMIHNLQGISSTVCTWSSCQQLCQSISMFICLMWSFMVWCIYYICVYYNFVFATLTSVAWGEILKLQYSMYTSIKFHWFLLSVLWILTKTSFYFLSKHDESGNGA